MAWSLRRRTIAPMPREAFEGPPPPVMVASTEVLSDDYLIEGDEEPIRPSAVSQLAQFLQLLMIIVIAVLSFATFWVVALMLNIF